MERPTNLQMTNEWFEHYDTNERQSVSIQKIRDGAKRFAQLLCNNTPDDPDQTAALRKIREAVMTANYAIASHLTREEAEG